VLECHRLSLRYPTPCNHHVGTWKVSTTERPLSCDIQQRICGDTKSHRSHCAVCFRWFPVTHTVEPKQCVRRSAPPPSRPVRPQVPLTPTPQAAADAAPDPTCPKFPTHTPFVTCQPPPPRDTHTGLVALGNPEHFTVSDWAHSHQLELAIRTTTQSVVYDHTATDKYTVHCPAAAWILNKTGSCCRVMHVLHTRIGPYI
jgi:hypothetical protein